MAAIVSNVETVEEVRCMVGAVHHRPIKGRQLREMLDGTRLAQLGGKPAPVQSRAARDDDDLIL